MRRNAPVVSSVIGCFALLAVGVVSSPPARAHSSYVAPFLARYPTTTLNTQMLSITGSNCNMCHSPNDSRADPATCYKGDLSNRLALGRTIAQAINDIDGMDSDGDGVPNGREITTPRTDVPGAVGYHPGLRGALGTDPCGTSATVAVTNRRETPCLADFNASGALTVQDIFDFLTAWFNGNATADFNAVGGLAVQDIFDFLGAWFAGC